MKLSVIVPTRERKNLLLECVGSIASLRSIRCELIIIDDGSRESSEAGIVNLLKQRSSTCELVYLSQPSLGAQFARNRGFEASTGDFVMFVDDDDVVVPEGIVHAVEELIKSSADFVHGIVKLVDADLTDLSGPIMVGDDYESAPIEFAGYHWHTMGAIYRRELLAKVGNWKTTLTGSQDWEYQARVKMHAGSHKFTKAVMGLWRQHNHSRIGKRSYDRRYVESVVDACMSIESHAQLLSLSDSFLSSRLARRIFWHALEASINGDRSEAELFLGKATALRDLPYLQKAALRFYRLLPRFIDSIMCMTIRSMKFIGPTS